jgi:hypothetical protein
MATQAQIEANRRNAQKSTGPRTEAGKARCRLNAVKQGRWARTETPDLLQEDPRDQAARVRQWTKDMRPRNAVERALVSRAARLSYMLEGADRAAGDGTTASERLHRYQTARGRELVQTIDLLIRMQRAAIVPPARPASVPVVGWVGRPRDGAKPEMMEISSCGEAAPTAPQALANANGSSDRASRDRCCGDCRSQNATTEAAIESTQVKGMHSVPITLGRTVERERSRCAGDGQAGDEARPQDREPAEMWVRMRPCKPGRVRLARDGKRVPGKTLPGEPYAARSRAWQSSSRRDTIS